MSEQATTTCPVCEAPLVTAGAAQLQPIRCAGCRASFLLGTIGKPVRTSRKALASLILGLSALTCTVLSGIPAIVLGMLALRDMRRQPGILLGRGFAWAGIISGTVLGLGGGLLLLAVSGIVMWISSSLERTKDPVRVREIAATMADFELPPGMKPTSGVLVLGIKHADFVLDEDQGADHLKIRLVHYSNSMLLNRKQVRAQLVYYQHDLGGSKIESTRKWTCHTADQEVEVTEQVCSEPDGQLFRNYIAVLPARDGNVLAMIVVEEPQTAGDAPRLTTEMVRQFFESFEVPESSD